MRGIAPLGDRQSLQIGVELLSRRLRHVGREHGLGMPRRKAASGIGRTCLHEHRSTLRTARHIEWPSHGIMITAMIDRSNALAPRIEAAGPVIDHGIRGPAVPQLIHHLHEFLTTRVPIGVADLACAAVIFCRSGQPRGHDVPCSAAVADVIDRRKLPRQVEGLGVGGRRGGDQTHPSGRHGERRQHSDRLQPGARRLRHVTAERQLIGKEDGIEQRCLGPLRQVLVVADVGQWQWRRGRMAPRRFVMPATVDEQIQVQLPFHGRCPVAISVQP